MRNFFLFVLFVSVSVVFANESADITDVLELYKKNEREQAFDMAHRILDSELYLESEKYILMGFLSDIFVSEKNYADAIDYADKMIEMKPELDKGYYLKGLGSWYLHDYISAVKALSKAIDIAPNKKQYHFIRGYINYDLFKDCYIREKDGEKNDDYYSALSLCIDDFCDEVRIDKRNYHSVYMLGLLMGMYMDEKTSDGKKALQLSISLLNKAIEMNPNFIDSYFVLALIYGSEKNYNIELAYYNANKYIELLENTNSNSTLEKSHEFDSSVYNMYTIRGDYYRENKKYELALKDYEIAISLKQSLGINYFNKIRIYQKMIKTANNSAKKKYEKLIEENEKSIKKNDPSFDLQKDEKMIDEYEKARRSGIPIEYHEFSVGMEN
ncbi:tetratricopeptide repeat protein [Treponema zioleckii]|uniref:tetratricopeptide repeat protein n=1 Tax=Treponema zioleckii TaxID=331680 RepID=UPI00168A6076|nr:hypothetical protein [Treponema zioleckii]